MLEKSFDCLTGLGKITTELIHWRAGSAVNIYVLVVRIIAIGNKLRAAKCAPACIAYFTVPGAVNCVVNFLVRVQGFGHIRKHAAVAGHECCNQGKQQQDGSQCASTVQSWLCGKSQPDYGQCNQRT